MISSSKKKLVVTVVGSGLFATSSFSQAYLTEEQGRAVYAYYSSQGMTYSEWLELRAEYDSNKWDGAADKVAYEKQLTGKKEPSSFDFLLRWFGFKTEMEGNFYCGSCDITYEQLFSIGQVPCFSAETGSFLESDVNLTQDKWEIGDQVVITDGDKYIILEFMANGNWKLVEKGEGRGPGEAKNPRPDSVENGDSGASASASGSGSSSSGGSSGGGGQSSNTGEPDYIDNPYGDYSGGYPGECSGCTVTMTEWG